MGRLDNMKSWKGISVSEKDYTSTLANALYDLSEIPNKTKKEHLLRYSDKHSLSIAKDIDESYCSTVGSVVLLMEKSFPFNEKSLESFNKIIGRLPKEKGKKKVEKQVQASNLPKILQWIDSLQQGCKKGTDKPQRISEIPFKLSKEDISEISLEYQHDKEEIEQVLAGDEYLLEGYDTYTKWELKRLDIFYKELYTYLNKEPVKKERKKRKIDANKLVQKLQYCKTFESFISINPKDIIGSKSLVVFDTDKKVLRYYTGELSVKGTTITGFNDSSFTKKLKDVTFLNNILAVQSKGLLKFIEGLKGVKGSITGRMNENCLILKKV